MTQVNLAPINRRDPQPGELAEMVSDWIEARITILNQPFTAYMCTLELRRMFPSVEIWHNEVRAVMVHIMEDKINNGGLVWHGEYKIYAVLDRPGVQQSAWTWMPGTDPSQVQTTSQKIAGFIGNLIHWKK